MRLVDTKTQILTIPAAVGLTVGFINVGSPRLAQLSVKAGDEGGYPLRGPAMDAIFCPRPKIVFTVSIAGGTTLDAFLPLRARLNEYTFGTDGVSSLVKYHNINAMLNWTGGVVGMDLSHAAVSQGELVLTNIGTLALRVSVRTEVFSDQEAI